MSENKVKPMRKVAVVAAAREEVAAEWVGQVEARNVG